MVPESVVTSVLEVKGVVLDKPDWTYKHAKCPERANHRYLKLEQSVLWLGCVFVDVKLLGCIFDDAMNTCEASKIGQ